MLNTQAEKKLEQLLAVSGFDRGEAKILACPAGGNNQACVLEFENTKLLAKFYLSDQKDRLGSETAFIQYAWARGITCVPKLIGCDKEANLAIYSFIDGEKIKSENITKAEIDQTIKFIQVLNQLPNNKALNLPVASEACFSLYDHIQLVEKRLKGLMSNGYEGPLANEFQAFMQKVNNTWHNLTNDIAALSKHKKQDLNKMLDKAEQCISPSDFGFHNVLQEKNGKLSFIDFEYAGWDDPAKMVVDFFLQPAIPVNNKFYKTFLDAVCHIFPNDENLQWRCDILHPVLAIKWCCIMMNCFSPNYAERALFAENKLSLLQHQTDRLQTAQQRLDAIPNLQRNFA